MAFARAWAAILIVTAGLGCTGKNQDAGVAPDAGDGDAAGGDAAGGDAAGGERATDGAPSGVFLAALTVPARVDLVFAIDNSASMADKHAIFAQSADELVGRLTRPRCVDTNGQTIPSGGVPTTVDEQGHCASGAPEFAPVGDLHIGVVTSSIGGRGATYTCSPAQTNPVNANLSAHTDDQAHLINRVGPDEHALADLGTSNYLDWYPTGSAPDAGAPALKDPLALKADFADVVAGVHQWGCGLEAQLESWYRFLIQPDPYASISGAGTAARTLTGVDATLLTQRHDFLRPDSLVAVIVLTDEDDSTVDPMWSNGNGWAYAEVSKFGATGFPGSIGGGAPRGTAPCGATPTDPACTSCGLTDPSGKPVADPNDPNCKRMGDANGGACGPGCLGYYPSVDDDINVRMVRMKERYGVDPQFPIYRYVQGLRSPLVPDRTTELHDGPAGAYSAPELPGETGYDRLCTNPLFAAALPASADGELCHLPRGPRTPQMVYLLTIAGVPWQLLADATAPGMPPKATLTADDWVKIVGQSPEDYDYQGQDPHMVAARLPNGSARWGGMPGDGTGRSGLPPPSAADDADPISGREWDTRGSNLQSACVFDLPTPKDCSVPENRFACDCTGGTPTAPDYRNPPLCSPTNHLMQIRARAEPGTRILTVARNLGPQGVAGSICARSSDPGSADFGYRPPLRALVDRIKSATASAGCVSTSSQRCKVVARLAASDACSTVPGLSSPQTNDDALFAALAGASGVCLVNQVPACDPSAPPGYCLAKTTTCDAKATPTPALALPAGATLYLACLP
jgi:hypothetical protein